MVKYAILNSKGFNKLKNKQPWIYNKEIKDLQANPGDIVKVFYKDKPVATAFANPISKIALRIISYSHNINTDALIKRKILNAINKRYIFNNTNAIRLFHSDADGLSGLIVDKYGDNLICSFDTAGIDRLKGKIVDILKYSLNPKGIFEKSSNIRKKEGLKTENTLLLGEVDDEFTVIENGFKFITNLKSGQKTGFYLDQRKNRNIIRNLKAKYALDLFASSGGFGIYSKANFVKFVEISKRNCDLIEQNASINKLKQYKILNSDVFDFLKEETQNYDLIVIDPPAFAKNKHSKNGAMRGYKYLISNSIKLLLDGGYIAIFSCSFAIGFQELIDLVKSVSIEQNVEIEILEFLKQDYDHPYLVNIPESLYLTGLLIKKNNS